MFSYKSSLLFTSNEKATNQHNCLADYLSLHTIQNGDEIFYEDYGISMLFHGKPPKRVHPPANYPSVISVIVTHSKIKQIKQQQNENDKITPLTINDIPSSSRKEKIEHLNKSPSHLITPNGILYKLALFRSNSATKSKLTYLPSSMINFFLQLYHSDSLSGHFSVQRTYLKIKNKFWWPKMKPSIIQHIQSCLPCQQYNISCTKKPGRLNPIPTLEGSFQLIGIDYCGPFKPIPGGNQYILGITDYLTRWVITVALPDRSVQTTAQTLFNNIYLLPPRLPLLIILIELQHLPPNNSPTYVKIKEVFILIFRFENKLYSWGNMDKELDPTKDYHLFNWPTLASLTVI
ncbi:unnamed protein product [Rotaria sp. Silwood1]|nr:unnamed protein product [Rotaria sp. Silwood1]CAF4982500.1 unnamed protein product [Rotaria sp. Silwood1]